MKERLIVWTIASLLPIVAVAGNIETFTTGPSGQGDLVFKAKSTGTTNLALGASGIYNVTVNPNYSITFGDLTVGDSLIVNTNAAVGGKTTLNGELEVNNSDVDINMTLTNNTVRIDQTNSVGTPDIPFVKITDKRTGATANTAGEATLVVDSYGTHSITATNGIITVGAEIETAGDLTIDPGDNDLIVDATVDATAYTSDAGAGLDVKSAGTLKLGEVTATAVEISKAGVGTTIEGTLNVDEAVVLDSTLGVINTISNNTLTASLPVFTDASKKLVSGTLGDGWTNATAVGTLTAVQSTVATNSTAAATLTPGSLSVSTGATATATLTKLQSTVATNSTAAFTPQTITLTYAATNAPSVTVNLFTTGIFDSTGGACTNANGVALVVVTNVTVTATLTPGTQDVATNGTVAMTPQTVVLDYAGTNDPTVTVSAQNTTLTYAATNAPAVTMTPQTTVLNYAGTNAPSITLTPETGTFAKP